MSQVQRATSGRTLPTITSVPPPPDTLPVYEKMALAAKDAFMEVCGEKAWLREIAFAMQIIQGNKLLQDVAKTPAGAQSIKNSIINVAMTGTTLNPVLQLAFLVPRSIKGVMMCCLDFSYRGLAGIAMNSGAVKHIAPRVVYTFDEFDYREEDGEQHITFKKNMDPPPDFIAAPAAKFWDYVLCGYVVATLADGTKIVTEPLPKWKLKKAMETSKTSGSNTPWQTHPDEQCLKTLVKHAYKLLPQTPVMSKAVSLLNEHEGIETEADRRASAFASAESALNGAEDATYTDVQPGAAQQQGGSAGNQSAAAPRETEVVMLITPSQCEEINRRIAEVNANVEQFLAFLGVKNIADIPQSSYGNAIAALENKKRQNESAANRSTGQGEQQDLLGGTQAPYTNAAIISALSSKHIGFETNEETGIIYVKLSHNDGANREFVKALGFKWNPDPQAKNWYWTPEF